MNRRHAVAATLMIAVTAVVVWQVLARRTVPSGRVSKAIPPAAFKPLTRSCVPSWPDTAEISGTLRVELKFGPPGYGENPGTDARYRIPIVHLDAPLDACAGEASAALRGVRQIQLQLADWAEVAALQNKRVRARGTLHQAVIGPEYTDAVMEVRKLVAAS